jgi:hypothetical protein
MNSSSRSRRLVVIIVILLITNLAILAFFLWPRFKHSKQPDENRQGYGMAETLKKEVGLDSQQVKELETLRGAHRKKMQPLFKELQDAKSQFYALLKKPETPDSVIIQAADLIGQKQEQVDIQVFQHFKNSRSVLRPDQQPKYDSLIQVILKKMSGPPGRGKTSESRPGDRRDN